MISNETKRRSVLDFQGQELPPDFDIESEPSMEFMATNAVPGSVEKINVLCWRLEQGLPLWHPDDRTDCVGISLIKDQFKSVRVDAPPRNRKPKTKENNSC